MENIKTSSYEMKYMETDTAKRVEAEKRLHFPKESRALEFFGNMQGEHREFTLFEEEKLARGYKDRNTSFDILHKYWLNVFHNDQGFTKEDKEAYIKLNGTTNNKKTCGMNGMGVIHTISRILEPGLVAVTRSLPDRQKCYIGEYQHSGWHSFDEDKDDEDEIIYNNRNGIGSSTMIPISEESYRELNQCKKIAQKFHGIAISEGKCKFFWNNEELLSKRTLDIKKAITIEYSLLHDTIKPSKAKSCPVILQILNIDNVREYLCKKGYTKKQTEEKIPEYIQISGRKNHTKLELYKQKNTFIKIETGTLICDVLKKSDVERRINEGDMDTGVSVVLNKMYIINPQALIKGLKGVKSNGWAWDSDYGGQPVIENHVCKNTEQYGMSSRKDDIESKTKGNHVHKFARTICRLAFNKEAVDKSDLNKNTTTNRNTKDTNKERNKSNSSDEESDDTTTIESYHEDDILSTNHVSTSNNNINKQKERHSPKIVTKYLYAFTLEGSEDWKNREGFTTYKCGVTTQHYSERFKEHGRGHPRNKIKPILVYKFMEEHNNSVEREWFVSIESADRKYRVDSLGTTTSEFFEIPTENAIDFFKKHIDIAMKTCSRRRGEYIKISGGFK
jgi:hypothetical protein